MNSRFWVLALWLACCALPVRAAGGGGSGGGGSSGAGETAQQSADPDFNAGLSAADRQDWQDVIDNMKKVVERDDQNADAWNHLGHAYRLLGDMDNSFKHYEVALRINPRHRRAHEYVGEAYLQIGDLRGAEQHLKVLDKLCWLPCEEYTDLKQKVEQYKREKAQ